MGDLKNHNPIKVFIIGDHPITNIGLKSIFDQTNDIHAKGYGPSSLHTLDEVNEQNPDVVIIDSYLCDLTGEFVASEIKRQEAFKAILVLVPIIDEVHFRRMLAAGVSGYLLKTESVNIILECVRVISRGEKRVSSSLMGLLTNNRDGENFTKLVFTQREKEILRLVAHGKSNNDIAHSLSIAEATVKNHTVHIYSKRKNLFDRSEP